MDVNKPNSDSVKEKLSSFVFADKPTGDCTGQVVRPDDFNAYLDRLHSFQSVTWFAKPLWLSPPVCARYGWRNVQADWLQCVTCRAFLSGTLPASHKPRAYAECCARLQKSLTSAHHRYCRWPTYPSPETFLQIQDPDQSSYKEKLQSLIALGKRLPAVDESSVHEMGLGSEVLERIRARLGIPDDVDEEVFTSAAVLAVCGWRPGGSVLKCDYCSRECGLWNYIQLDGSDTLSSDEDEEEIVPSKKQNYDPSETTESAMITENTQTETVTENEAQSNQECTSTETNRSTSPDTKLDTETVQTDPETGPKKCFSETEPENKESDETVKQDAQTPSNGTSEPSNIESEEIQENYTQGKPSEISSICQSETDAMNENKPIDEPASDLTQRLEKDAKEDPEKERHETDIAQTQSESENKDESQAHLRTETPNVSSAPKDIASSPDTEGIKLQSESQNIDDSVAKHSVESLSDSTDPEKCLPCTDIDSENKNNSNNNDANSASTSYQDSQNEHLSENETEQEIGQSHDIAIVEEHPENIRGSDFISDDEDMDYSEILEHLPLADDDGNVSNESVSSDDVIIHAGSDDNSNNNNSSVLESDGDSSDEEGGGGSEPEEIDLEVESPGDDSEGDYDVEHDVIDDGNVVIEYDDDGNEIYRQVGSENHEYEQYDEQDDVSDVMSEEEIEDEEDGEEMSAADEYESSGSDEAYAEMQPHVKTNTNRNNPEGAIVIIDSSSEEEEEEEEEEIEDESEEEEEEEEEEHSELNVDGYIVADEEEIVEHAEQGEIEEQIEELEEVEVENENEEICEEIIDGQQLLFEDNQEVESENGSGIQEEVIYQNPDIVYTGQEDKPGDDFKLEIEQVSDIATEQGYPQMQEQQKPEMAPDGQIGEDMYEEEDTKVADLKQAEEMNTNIGGTENLVETEEFEGDNYGNEQASAVNESRFEPVETSQEDSEDFYIQKTTRTKESLDTDHVDDHQQKHERDENGDGSDQNDENIHHDETDVVGTIEPEVSDNGSDEVIVASSGGEDIDSNGDIIVDSPGEEEFEHPHIEQSGTAGPESVVEETKIIESEEKLNQKKATANKMSQDASVGVEMKADIVEINSSVESIHNVSIIEINSSIVEISSVTDTDPNVSQEEREGDEKTGNSQSLAPDYKIPKLSESKSNTTPSHTSSANTEDTSALESVKTEARRQTMEVDIEHVTESEINTQSEELQKATKETRPKESVMRLRLESSDNSDIDIDDDNIEAKLPKEEPSCSYSQPKTVFGELIFTSNDSNDSARTPRSQSSASLAPNPYASRASTPDAQFSECSQPVSQMGMECDEAPAKTAKETSEGGNLKRKRKSRRAHLQPLQEHRAWCVWVAPPAKLLARKSASISTSDTGGNAALAGWQIVLSSLSQEDIPSQQTCVSVAQLIKTSPMHENLRRIRGLFDGWASSHVTPPHVTSTHVTTPHVAMTES